MSHPDLRFSLQQRLTGHEGAVYALSKGVEEDTVLSAGSDGWIVEWDLHNPDPGRLLARVQARVFSLLAMSECQILLAGDIDGGVHWLDLANPDANRHIQHHKKGTYGFAQHAGMIFSGGGDGLLTRWSLSERRSDESLQISHRSIRTLRFSPGGDVLAAGCSDGSICLIDPLRMAVLHRIRDAHPPSVFSLQFNASGNRLWSGGRDAQLRCWDLMGVPVFQAGAAAHWYTINAIALSPDGEVLATASRDKSIRIWREADSQLIQALDTVRDQGHRHSVNALYWSAYGNRLISASDDHTLCIWKPG